MWAETNVFRKRLFSDQKLTFSGNVCFLETFVLRAETNVSRVSELVCFFLGGGGPQRLFHRQKLTFSGNVCYWIYTYIYIYVYMYMYICIYVCIYIGVYVYRNMCIRVYMHIYIYVYMYIIYICMYIALVSDPETNVSGKH